MGEKKLPTLAKVLEITLFLIGIIFIFVSAFLFIGGDLGHNTEFIRASGGIFLLGMFTIISSIFVLKRKNWARWAQVILLGIYLMIYLIYLSIIIIIIYLLPIFILGILMLIYLLFSKKLKEAFN